MSQQQLRANADKLGRYLDNLKAARKGSVRVGLPQEEVGGQVYGDGGTVMTVGASHEFGIGVPQRSFLRMPFQVKAAELEALMAGQFKLVFDDGLDATTALGRIGAGAAGISKGAFTTRGYGNWPDISEATKFQKGSSQVLIDTGLLRSSITWAVDT